ncbi:sulfate/molybdate ABC transporter ATP-binding protein [Effusibacillus lacus]|uniref:Sulfate ABC transporter ATP-binding protein n=1 Tax=Effusibacillus lacus TaxID=1348429 RepID=A0A292YGX0_9BACL|nr:sulfate ABC transporter ATP-binding protein [Effusibacillus lacus]TCS74269.1 sulfate transport system ATP-binding protein [Effusibacillus lacus]GAX88728.1 sulfate ABC transporter ATP-binding protein [Effusibacillus lacus]
MSIEVRNITKKYGSFTVIQNLNLEIPTGELVVLLGPSGSGKTTLLRAIAGLERTDIGQILLNGEDATHLGPRDRGIGFVFQNYALFRHMNVFENVAFGLRVRPRKLRPSEKEIRDRVHELLKLVQLEEFAKRFPSQLSGGQCQRVALARALAVEPKVLLLDEPFGALDAKVRQELRSWLRNIHDELHITSVFVTHDQEEALEVADRIVVINEGQIEQVGTPEEVYTHPATPFVYNFIGRVNVISGQVQEGRIRIGNLEAEVPEGFGTSAICYVRPHDIEIETQRENQSENQSTNAIEATIRHINIIGPVARLDLKRSDTGEFIQAEISNDMYQRLGLKVNQPVYVKFRNLKVFAQEKSLGKGPQDDSEALPVGSVSLNANLHVS